MAFLQAASPGTEKEVSHRTTFEIVVGNDRCDVAHTSAALGHGLHAVAERAA